MSGKATVPQRISNQDMDLDEEDDDEAGSTAASAKCKTPPFFDFLFVGNQRRLFELISVGLEQLIP